jgi:hypothetical protein
MIKRNINNIGQPLVTAAGVLLSGINITFTLAKGSTPASTFDAITKEKIVSIPNVVTTNEHGEFSIDLWCTSRGVDVLEYVCAVDIMGVQPFRAPLSEGLIPLKWADFKASGAVLLPTELDAFTLHLQDNARHLSPELAAGVGSILSTFINNGAGNKYLANDGTYKLIPDLISNHAQLTNLDYASSGHTGFAKSNIITEAASPAEEAAAFAAGAMIVIRTDLL